MDELNQNQPKQPVQPQPTPVDPALKSQNNEPSTSGPASQRRLDMQLPESEPKKHKRDVRSLLSTIGVFLLAPILAIILTAFVFQSYEVDGPSMETTLQHQDRLVVYKLPKTWADLRGQDYIPSRGEIIVFDQLTGSEFSANESKQLIKRVIGLPGDRVVIKNGKVSVINIDNPNGFNPDADTDNLDPGEKTEGDIDVNVGEGEVFVLGDNRGNSLDSRTFGPVPADLITGELVLRIYPFHQFEGF